MKKLIIVAIASLFVTVAVSQTKSSDLSLNDKAPEFSSKDQNNKAIVLKDEVKKGSVVLIFYRGEWCPYCNKQLKGLEDSLSEITKKGATLLAITPEKMENVAKTVEKTKATYSIISDEKLKIMDAYKVSFKVDDKTNAALKGYGVNLMERNGTNGENLPVPAVYIINKEGKIVYKHVDPDYTKRVSVQEILSHL
jgi:peroxiredoxin